MGKEELQQEHDQEHDTKDQKEQDAWTSREQDAGQAGTKYTPGRN